MGSRTGVKTPRARNTRKALLLGLLQPKARLVEAEEQGDFAKRLALQEDARSLPWGAVWEEFSARQETPVDGRWFDSVKSYETSVLLKRSLA
ncbi:MAG: L-rhamnose isomerase [Verrucomicrobiales bacterium]